ncbi:MAG: zinc-dependent alcohol dehydrogenase family protein [Gammaproteobacteria bacterium]
MRAMCLDAPNTPLIARDLPVPVPAADEVLIEVAACAVCRTDLHIVDGELSEPKLPLIPGHEIVGRVAAVGRAVERLKAGMRVGVPWLGATCGRCDYCRSGHENLCPEARFTGYHRDGGYAGYTLAKADYAFEIRGDYTDIEAAPLLCAGLIGHRCLRMTGDARRLGLMGFGAAAHIVAQVARYEGREIYAFTRPGDVAAQAFARMLGATWAGDASDVAPVPLDAVIIFAPVGALVPLALRCVRPGGIVVCGGIHMSDIPAFPYSILWGERKIVSVANLTRRDAEEFLALAPKVPVKTEITVMPLAAANEALARLRRGEVSGAVVLACE